MSYILTVLLHHTKNPYQGFLECVRVLKPGGVLFILLYSKGGLVNNILNFFRLFTTRSIPPLSIMKAISRKIFGEDKNHYWYALLDGLYAPYRETYTSTEIEEWFGNNKIINVKKYQCTWGYTNWPTFFSGKDRAI